MERELSPYLQRVLRLLVQGLSHQEIASELSVSKSTIDTYVKRLRQFFADTPELQDTQLSRGMRLILAGRRYLEQEQGLHVSDRTPAENILEGFGFSISLSELAREEYLHIDPERRQEALANAAQMINNLAPIEERDRIRLRLIKSLSSLGDKVLGLNTYIDHEIDHAVMLILKWLPRGDTSRWRELRQNLDRLIDILCRDLPEGNSDLRTLRVLNTLLCYAHRFGPPGLSDKAMHCAIELWDAQPDLASAYVFRDMLQCDAFLNHPIAQDRFYDFLNGVLRGSPDAATDSSNQVIPALEILYFSPAVWTYQNEILDHQLLPDPSQTHRSDLARVLRQVLNHLNDPELPALSMANYLLDCITLAKTHKGILFPMLNQGLVDDMMAVVSASLPSSFRGIPLLNDIWSETVRLFEGINRAWTRAGATFVAGMEGKWN